MTNWRASISYDGGLYKGFQIQPIEQTVGGCLQSVITKIFENPVKIISAGRTDSGVHAEGQVISFSGMTRLDKNTLAKAIRAQLPKEIRLISLDSVSETFNARRNATSRSYSYLMADTDVPLWLNARVAQFSNIKFDLVFFNKLADLLIGEKEFDCFRNMGSFDGSSKRKIYESYFSIREINDLYGKNPPFKYFEYRIKGSGFLYRMVRNIIGAMLQVHNKKYSLEDFREMIETKQRLITYAPAPSHGLCFREAGYEGE